MRYKKCFALPQTTSGRLVMAFFHLFYYVPYSSGSLNMEPEKKIGTQYTKQSRGGGLLIFKSNCTKSTYLDKNSIAHYEEDLILRAAKLIEAN